MALGMGSFLTQVAAGTLTSYLHLIKPISVEQWLRSLQELSDGSKAKIRNIMSAVFSHAIRFEIADKNPITPVRQSAKRTKVPVILDPAELKRLFGELGNSGTRNDYRRRTDRHPTK
jgi:site-specific recombinase XerD